MVNKKYPIRHSIVIVNSIATGFHEAVGDTLALSVKTPKHLKEIGLLDESTPIDDYQTSINFLLSIALAKVAFLPFGYLIDKYRWDIFDGTVNETEYNAYWWKLRFGKLSSSINNRKFFTKKKCTNSFSFKGKNIKESNHPAFEPKNILTPVQSITSPLTSSI